MSDDDFGSIEEFGGSGSIFRPKDYANAAAILFRPTAFRPGGSRFADGEGKKKDLLVADYHVFRSLDDVRAGTPSEVLVGAINDNAGIARRGKSMLEAKKVAPVILDQVKTDKGNAWTFVSPERDVCNAVRGYWQGVKAAEDAASKEFDSLFGADA